MHTIWNAPGAFEKMTPDQRSKASADLTFNTFFYFGVKAPIAAEKATQMGLERMTEQELKAMGIEKKVCDLLPPYKEGGKTYGLLMAGESELPLVSGVNGPAASIPKGTKGFDAYTRTHVEGHAAAFMREHGIKSAQLHINNPSICGNCDRLLPRMLETGSQLEVILPDGTSKIFIGEKR
jgi:hypothetical protein